MTIEIVNVADLEDPNDPEGRTYRQVNAATSHKIPIGAFVELEDGCRSWVVAHGRDCDKTPLYYLCMDKNNTEPRSMVFKNPGWEGGYSAESLKIISTPEDPCP
jgi:hypothetical protein